MYELMIQLRVYLSGIWKYRWIGISTSWLVCLGGWGYIYIIPDLYEAKSVVQVDTSSALKPILKGLTVDTDASQTISVMTKKLLSRPTLERIIRESDLAIRVSSKIQMNRMVAKLTKTIIVKSPKSKGRQADANPTFKISFIDRDPQIAFSVVKKLLDILVEDTLGASRSDTNIAERFLLEQIKDYETRLLSAEQRLADFKKKNVGLMPGEGGGFYVRLQQALDLRTKTKTELVLAKRKLGVLRAQLQSEIPLSVNRSYDGRIKEQQEALDALLLKFTEQHPDVEAVRAIINRLKKNKKEAASNSVTTEASAALLEQNPVYQTVKIALKEAEVQVVDLETQYAQQNRTIRDLRSLVDTVPEVEAQLVRLNRDYEVNKVQHAALLTRLESARLSSSAGKSSEEIEFDIIDPPYVPLSPISPNRLLLQVAALAAGLGAFFGITFLILQLKPVFLTTNDLAAATELPILGSVSMIIHKDKRIQKTKERVIIVFLLILLLVSFGFVVAMPR